MTERATFDPFERRIADDLERYVAPARDHRPATVVAAMAMRPRGRMVGARSGPRVQRFALLGLAAAFLVPAAYLGAIGVQPTVPNQIDQVQLSRTVDSRQTAPPSTGLPFDYVSIFVRRDDDPEPGVSIFAVRPGGGEALVRKVPDSVVPGGGTLSEWGTVSEWGWLALGVELHGGPWPMVLIDLADDDVQPWVIDEANLGGIGPRWGPTGLIAAVADTWSTLVIADPETRETRRVSMQGRGLVGGGPSIVWTADGSGIIGSTDGRVFEVVPIDGGDAGPAVDAVFDPRGFYGPGLAELRICSPDVVCPVGDDGRVERVESDGSARTIWRQTSDDRAMAANFGSRTGEYWLTLDHDKGRQLALVHVSNGREDTIATVNRAPDWQYVAAPIVAPDQSTALLWIDIGAAAAAVLVPLTGFPPTFHVGHFAGFVDSAVSARFTTGQHGAPAQTMPPVGERYRLPSLRELIDAELNLNPGRRVLGKASRDGVDGEAGARTFEVRRDKPGAGEAYLDCLGPSAVTVKSGADSTTSPCLRAGSYSFQVDRSEPVIVSSSGDTSWRVVIYSN